MLVTKVKGNKREAPPLNQLLQRDVTVSNLIADEPLTTLSATDTGKGCINTQAEASATGLCERREICRESLTGMEFTSPHAVAFSPTSREAAGLSAGLAWAETDKSIYFRSVQNSFMCCSRGRIS